MYSAQYKSQTADKPECLDKDHSCKVTQTNECLQYSNIKVMSATAN